MTPEEQNKAKQLLSVLKRKRFEYQSASKEVTKLMQENDGSLDPSMVYENASDIYKQMNIEEKAYMQYVAAKMEFRKLMDSID